MSGGHRSQDAPPKVIANSGRSARTRLGLRVYTQGLDAKALVVPLESLHGKGCGERTISRAEYWEWLLQNKR